MLDSLVRVSRRAAFNHYANILAEAQSSIPANSIPKSYNTTEVATFLMIYPAARIDVGPVKFLRGPSPREASACKKHHVWSNALPFQQFHVLFHSLFKVLFIFPSLYLFAIGLSPIFSFRWNLPPTLSCIPKQLDSSKKSYREKVSSPNGILTLYDVLFQGT